MMLVKIAKAKVMMLVIYQFLKMLIKDNLRAISGTLFQAEQASLENKSGTLRTDVELQLKTFVQKDQECTSYSQRAVQSGSAFRLFVDEPCFVLFRNSRSSMDKSITKTFQLSFASWINYGVRSGIT